MKEGAYVSFRLPDASATYTTVNVAGTFNNWSPVADRLDYEVDSGCWVNERNVDLPVGEKVLFKYVTNASNWHCDMELPHEADASGNLNNVGFVLKKKVADDFNPSDLHDTGEGTGSNETSGVFENATNRPRSSSVLKKPADLVDSSASTLKVIPTSGTKTALGRFTQNTWNSITLFFNYYILPLFFSQQSVNSQS